MLPLLLATDATKKGLLSFVQQTGLAVLSELLAFVCLGLPDTILGVAWPAVRRSLGLDVEIAGVRPC